MNNKLINKYNILNINDMFYDDLLKNKLNNIIKDLDNIIFFGNVGSGKTSIVNCIKRKYKCYLQLSNFNSKGYDYIMTSINDFLKQKKDQIKIIIFDNLDNISNKAQHIISDIINVKNCKLVITCSDLNNIIESIQSNCIIVKLKIDKNILFNNLKFICENQNIKFSEESLYYLIDIYNYDIRKIINIIDVINISFGDINNDNIYKILNNIDTHKLKNIIKNLLDKQFKQSIILVNSLLDDGYSIDDVLLSLVNIINLDNNLKEINKLKLIDIINNKYITINKTINSQLQLYGCFAEICKLDISFEN